MAVKKAHRKAVDELWQMLRPKAVGPSAYDVWIGKLQDQTAAVNECRRFEITLAQCAELMREIGDTGQGWRSHGAGAGIDNAFNKRLRDLVRSNADQDRQENPSLWEPGGLRTLPMALGGMGDLHYARELTAEESALRAAWKAKHDPDGPEIREKLTLEERISAAKHDRYRIATRFEHDEPKEAADKRIAEWEETWAALMEVKRQQDEENARQERKTALGTTQRPPEVSAAQPAAAIPGGRPKRLRESTLGQGDQPEQSLPGPDKLAGYRDQRTQTTITDDAEAEAVLFEPERE